MSGFVADVVYDGAKAQGRCSCGWVGREAKAGSEKPYVDVDLHHCDSGHAAVSRPARLGVEGNPK